MWGRLGQIVLILVVLLSTVTVAEEVPQDVVKAQIDSANRYLSAEVSKQMRETKEEIVQDLKNYQDENFRELDSRMATVMEDVKMRTMMITAGVALVVNALAAIIIARSFRNYSFEKYQENMIGKLQEQVKLERSKGLQETQQQNWYVEQPAQTIGYDVGQAKASEMTQMNAWQAQQAYAGAWQAPIQAQPDYTYNREPGVVQRDITEKKPEFKEIVSGHLDDPLQSPEWGKWGGQSG